MIRSLRAAPVTVPCAVAILVLAWWAADSSGYALTTWAPGTLLVVALVGLALVIVPGGWRDAPRAVQVAVGALGAFTVWSYATILWAGGKGDALEGANRTLLYLALFVLFALWRQRGETAALLLGLWTGAVLIVAVVIVARIAAGGHEEALFYADRLSAPAGYPNAAAAALLMALWPALALAGASRVNPLVRGALAGGAVVVAGLALLCQSRGSILAVPLTAIAFLVVLPGRLRHLVLLLAVAAGVAVAAGGLLDLTDALTSAVAAGHPVGTGVARHAMQGLLLGAAGVAIVVAAVSVVLARRPPRPSVAARARQAGVLAAAVLAFSVVAGGLVVAGNPIARLDSAWTSFKGGYADQQKGSRLSSGLGSNRYDFYRVALNSFARSPIGGIGADNFQQDYLARGRSPETPRYPHSVELRTLAQTGLIGTALLLVALAAAVTAALRAAYAGRAAGAAAAAGALGVFAYWFVHGSADWFWEFAGLGGPAFALLGLACGLAPRRRPAGEHDLRASEGRACVRGPSRGAAPTARGRLGVAAVAVWCVAAVLVVAGPWLAQRDVEAAGRVFAANPPQAYERLHRAARFNPLSDRPALIEGSVAVRVGDLERADRAFARALDRTQRGAYATLQRAALASAAGRREEALSLLRRSRSLAPRDPLAREATGIVRGGGRLDVANLNRRILLEADAFQGG